MERFKGRVALVTGASSGIGAAVVRVLAQAGMRIALTARRGDRLDALKEELRDADMLSVVADLRQEQQIRCIPLPRICTRLWRQTAPQIFLCWGLRWRSSPYQCTQRDTFSHSHSKVVH